MLNEQAAKLPRSYAHPFSEFVDVAAIEATFQDQSQCARNDRGRAEPRRRPRRSFRPASPARTKTGGLSRGGADKQRDVIRSCEGYRANGAAVDSRCHSANKKSAVEAGISTMNCLPADVRREFCLTSSNRRARSGHRGVHNPILKDFGYRSW